MPKKRIVEISTHKAGNAFNFSYICDRYENIPQRIIYVFFFNVSGNFQKLQSLKSFRFSLINLLFHQYFEFICGKRLFMLSFATIFGLRAYVMCM